MMESNLKSLQEKLINIAKENKFLYQVETPEKLLNYFDSMVNNFVKPVIEYDTSLFASSKTEDGMYYNLNGKSLVVNIDSELVTFINKDKNENLLEVLVNNGLARVFRKNYNEQKTLTKQNLESVIVKAFS